MKQHSPIDDYSVNNLNAHFSSNATAIRIVKLIQSPSLTIIAAAIQLLKHFGFDTDQPILIIFGRDIAERVCYQMVVCYPTFPN